MVAPPPPGAVRERSDTQSPGQRSSRARATRGCVVQRQDARTPCFASNRIENRASFSREHPRPCACVARGSVRIARVRNARVLPSAGSPRWDTDLVGERREGAQAQGE